MGMTIITKQNISEFVVDGEFDIQAKFSEDEDAKKAGESKSVTLRFKMSQVPISAIIASSLKDKRINIQTTLRKHPEQYKDGQVIVLDYKGGAVPVDPEVAMAARLKAMTPEAQRAWFEQKRKELGL